MGLIVFEKEEYTQLEPGSYPATCTILIDCGTQNGVFEGKATRRKEVLLGWEISGEKRDDGAPFIFTKRYTASLNDKATLRKHLDNWRGVSFTEEELEGFALTNILGKTCMLTLSKPKKRLNVSSVSKLMKGTQVERPVSEIIYFDFDAPDRATYDRLGDWIKKILFESEEWASVDAAMGGGTVANYEDIPF